MRNERELLGYLKALRNYVMQSKQAGLTDGDGDVKESGQIFRAIFENAADGILLVDLENKKLHMGNRVICQMLGYGQHELRMLGIADIHWQDDLPYVTEQFERQVSGELTLAEDIPVKRKDGSVFYADINSFPITLGKKTYLMGIFRDITFRKQLEQERAMLARFPDENPNPVLRISENGTILYANRASSPVLETWRCHVGQTLPEACCKQMRETMNSGRISTFEFNCDDGRFFLITLAPVVEDGYQNVYGVDITERKKAEKALRKREEQYRSVVEDSPGLLCSFLPDGTIYFVNVAYCEYFGKSQKELIGSKFTLLIPEEDAQDVLSKILSLTVDSPILTHEHRIIAPDGQIRWQQWTNRALFDEQGRAILFQSFGEDITERKKAEEALERSEKKWYSLLRHAPDFILNLDRDGTILFINHTEPGYTIENTIGRTVYDFLSPGGHEKMREAINQVFETGAQVKFETSVIGPDGRLLWYLNHLGPIKDGDTVVSVAQVSADVTESKRLQVMLQTKNAAIASSINGIAISDGEGNLTYVNKSFLEMWGYGDENEVLGRNAVAFWQEQDQALEVIEALRDRGGWIGELTAVRRDGSAMDVQVCATSVIDENNKSIFMMASFVDVTESKKREQELITYRAQMAQAERLASLGTLSATIAHQVTQPLTVIRLSLDNVVDELERTSCSNKVLRRLQDSVAQVSNITSIINQFRNFARQSSDTAFGQVNVQAVVIRIVRLLHESAKQARVSLQVDNLSTLPPVILHEREFEQILFALVENAIQAADGKKARQIVISGSTKDEQIELRFSDNCGGIPPESLDRIFEPFFTTKPRGQGTGLGLCIVRDAVARVGGRVRVESEFGKGSTFFVTLPVSEE